MSRVELELHPRREKREGLDQALDVRIGALDTVHAETRRDARVRLGEFRTHFADVLELAVVVLEQP
jgi:hypothetical protein